MEKLENIVVQNYVIYIKDGLYHLVDTQDIEISYACSNDPDCYGARFEIDSHGYLILVINNGTEFKEIVYGEYIFSTIDIEVAALEYVKLRY